MSIRIFLVGEADPIEQVCEIKDVEFMANDTLRYATDKSLFKRRLDDYLKTIPKNGITVDNKWFPPKKVDYIEIGESHLAPL